MAQYHSRTGPVARRGGEGLAVLELQHRIDAGVVSRHRAGYCLGLVAAFARPQRQWVSATSDGGVLRTPNTVRRHP